MKHAVVLKKVALVTLTLAFMCLLVVNLQNKTENDIVKSYSNNPLDGCHHVFLDVGSNVGIQVFDFI